MEWTKNLKNWIFFYWIGLNFGFDFKRKMLYPLHYFLSPFPLPILIWLWLKWPSFFKPCSFPTLSHTPSPVIIHSFEGNETLPLFYYNCYFLSLPLWPLIQYFASIFLACLVSLYNISVFSPSSSQTWYACAPLLFLHN